MKNLPVSLPPFKVEKVVSTLSETAQWGITKLNVPETWKVTQGEGITVMVIDTGYTIHSDLEGAIDYDKCRYFIEKNLLDKNGHSTGCCGVIGARQNNMGCVGVAPKCTIITVKVLGEDGTGSMDAIVKALKYALEIKPDIVSMSLGSPEGTEALKEAIKALHEANICIVCAAGNEGGANTKTDTVNYPAKYPETIAVAAMDREGRIADYSSWGDRVDITGPGSDIYTTWLDNSYAKMYGTSFSAPFVTGVIALLLAKHRKQELETGQNDCKTVDQIREHLVKYADPETGNMSEIGQRDNSFGYGIINVNKMIFEISGNPQPLPPVKPISFFQKMLNYIKNYFSYKNL